MNDPLGTWNRVYDCLSQIALRRLDNNELDGDGIAKLGLPLIKGARAKLNLEIDTREKKLKRVELVDENQFQGVFSPPIDHAELSFLDSGELRFHPFSSSFKWDPNQIFESVLYYNFTEQRYFDMKNALYNTAISRLGNELLYSTFGQVFVTMGTQVERSQDFLIRKKDKGGGFEIGVGIDFGRYFPKWETPAPSDGGSHFQMLDVHTIIFPYAEIVDSAVRTVNDGRLLPQSLRAKEMNHNTLTQKLFDWNYSRNWYQRNIVNPGAGSCSRF